MSDYSRSQTSRRARDRYSVPDNANFVGSAANSRRAYSKKWHDEGDPDWNDEDPDPVPDLYESRRYYHSEPDLDADSDIDVDDEPRARAYRFRLDRPSPAPTATEDYEIVEELVLTDRRMDLGPRRVKSVANIMESRYTGLGVMGRPHGARVTVVEGAGTAEPLFRWIHFPWKALELDDFANEVSRTPGLTATETATIADVFDEVRRTCVRTLHTTGPRPARKLEPRSIRRNLPQEGTPNRAVTWICVPYFSLEPYSRLDSASGFPVRTLLQTQFSRAGKGRDMQQAVCMNGGAPAGHCYHVAQLWCLVLDNSLLFTCCRLPETGLFGDSIERILQIPDISDKPKKKISVTYRSSVMWSIPAEESETWLGFISHFREVFPRRLLFFRHKRRVTPGDWPKVWRAASRTSVTLELKIGRAPPPPQSGLLIKPQEDEVAPDLKPTEQPNNGPQPKPAQKTPTSATNLAILTCLDGVSTTDPFDRPALERQLEKVHQLLLRGTSFSDRRVYRSCPNYSRAALYLYLEAGGVDPLDSSAAKQEGVRDRPAPPQPNIDDKVDVFNAADAVFRFFFPTPAAGLPTAEKYWGAIGRLLRATPKGLDDNDIAPQYRSVQHLRTALRSLAAKLGPFIDIFKHASKQHRTRISVPDGLMEAWIHIVMGLAYFHSDREMAHELIHDAGGLIDEALRDMVMTLSDYTLREQAVLQPMELVSLISLELMMKAPPGLPDITGTYLNRLATISNEVISQPSDRSHERKIDLLCQEVKAIETTISRQASIFASLVLDARDTAARPSGPRRHITDKEQEEWEYERKMRPSGRTAGPGLKGGDGKLSLTGVEAGGYRTLLLDECSMNLSRMKADFDEIEHQIRLLLDLNKNKVDTTKDRQERAIYVFTIVTIIFLPLSAVSSIFGMNTADIRDMDLGQWAYWAAALPVTAAVIFLGLLFTGELRALLRWAVTGAEKEGGRQREVDWLQGEGVPKYVGRSRGDDSESSEEW